MLRRSLRPAGLLLLAASLLAACGEPLSEDSASDSASVPLISTAEAASLARREGGPAGAAEPPAAERLLPILRAVGHAGTLPEEIAVAFAIPLVPAGAVGSLTEGTKLSLQPPAGGSLRWTSESTLSFVPDAPLRPDTRYRVTLDSVGTAGGLVAAPHAAAWVYEFTTPRFSFRNAELRSIDFVQRRAELDLVFSGPVAPADVQRHLSVSVDGRKPQTLAVSSAELRHAARVSIVAPAMAPGSRLSLRLESGVALLSGPGEDVAASADASLVLRDDQSVRILSARRQEGPTGFFVEVVCDDGAVEDEYRDWWYDEPGEEWLQLSSRCIPDEKSARDAVRVEPPVPFSVVPGRHGFRVLGDFRRGSYALSIAGGLSTEDGGVLPGGFSATFVVPARSPQVSFVSQGRYLPRSAWKSLAVQHLNVSEISLEVRHVPKENLVFWLGGDDERVDERTSDRVAEVRVPVENPADAMATSWLDVARHVPDRGPGLYELVVHAGSRSDTARLLLTDLQIVAKRAAPLPGEPYSREVLVWALQSQDNRPVKGASLELRKKSGKALARCITDSEGACRLTVEPDPLDPSPPFAILATRGADLSYLRFADLLDPVGDSLVQGEPFASQKAYRMATYADRGVYRPGDTAHLVGILRGTEFRAPKTPPPVELQLSDPRGNVVVRRTLHPNAAGLVLWDQAFSDWASTGAWTARFAVAENVVGEETLHVEEFVPERMKVDVAPAAPATLLGEPIEARVSARYLFGGSAEGSPVELSCELRPEPVSPRKNANFHYGPWRDPEEAVPTVQLGAASGEIGPDGSTSLSCPGIPRGAAWEGSGRVVVRGAVFESGSGRSTQQTASAALHPDKHLVGLQSGATKAEAGRALTVSGVVVDWDGEPIATIPELQIELFRLEAEYGWMYDRNTGEERFRRYLRRVGDGGSSAAVSGGKFSVTVTPSADAAGYLVRARAGKAVSDLQIEGSGWSEFWWGDWQESVDETPRPLKPGSLEIELPASVTAGRAAEAKLVAPYRGRLLMTVETDRVEKSEWLDIEAGPVSWRFAAQKQVPNVYVSALLIKDPHLESPQAFAPGRSFGVASVRVDPAEYRQTVRIEAPSEVRPNTELEVTVDLGGSPTEPTWLTVAAVDEGILQLTKFQTPDPLAEVFARRALGVQSFETVGWTLLLAPQGESRRSGGDTQAGLGRVQGIKPVALWSGRVEVPKSGRATVKLPVPMYRGALRVMAVAAGASKLGSAEAQVLVRDPLNLQATLPRFLTAGDRAEVPVFVTNLTPDAQTVEVSISSELLEKYLGPATQSSPVRIRGESRRTLRLQPGESGTAVFEAQAVALVGAARIRVDAKAGALASWDQVDVPLMPAAPRERVVQRIELKEGTTDLRPYLAGWLPSTERSQFWVSRNPYGDVFGHLSWLVQYPYGCIEQTSSSTRPLLYVSRLLENVDPALSADGGVARRVQAGITRILSMQTPSGGFGYWPGAEEPTAWGSAYATQVLIEAKRLGHEVPQASVDSALGWLEQWSGEGQHQDWRHTAPYAQYVLALGGRGNKARVAEALAALPVGPAALGRREQEDATLLKAALWLLGDRRWEAELRALDLSAIGDARENDWSYWSERRTRALTLSVLTDLFGNDAALLPLERLVAQSLANQRSGWYTTQELAWGVTALGKRIAQGAKDFSPPVLTVDGRALPPRADPSGSSAERSWELPRASEHGSLALAVEEKGEGALWLLLSSEGVRQRASWKTGGEGLRITRTWQRSDGSPLGPSPQVELGDMVYAGVSLTNLGKERVQNVALVDRFPAGWEVENPRLGRDSAPPWAEEAVTWTYDHMDVRDDRVEVFGSLEAGETVTFVYAARATAAGSFSVPPAEAEAMYEPRIWAREGGGLATVLGPWEGVVEGE
jgi:uncharacterized protein YfaS (alpha-2-macroglobulin family)